MATDLERGDRVSWASGDSRARGTVERVLTRRTTVGGRPVAASASDPRYVLAEEKSGRTVVRKGDGLRKLAPKKPAAAGKPAARKKAAKKAPARKKAAARKKTAAREKPAAKKAPAARRSWIARRPVWQWAALGGGLAVLGIGAAVYFTQAPKGLADDYDEQAAPAFEKVDAEMLDVFETFRARYFRGLAIEDLAEKRVEEDLGRLRRAFRKQYDTDRATIAQANKEMAQAEQAIDEAEADLTEVDSWPLLGGVGELGDAEQKAEDAQDYLDDARDFMPLYRELIAYSKRTLALEERITDAVLDNAPAPDSSFETFQSSLERTVAELDKARKQFEALPKPPEDAEAFRYATDAGLIISEDFYGKVKQAFDDLNEGLIDEANDDLDKALKSFGIKVLLRFGELQEESDLARALEELESSEADLAEALGTEEGSESSVPPLIPPDPDKETEKAA